MDTARRYYMLKRFVAKCARLESEMEEEVSHSQAAFQLTRLRAESVGLEARWGDFARGLSEFFESEGDPVLAGKFLSFSDRFYEDAGALQNEVTRAVIDEFMAEVRRLGDEFKGARPPSGSLA